MSEVILINFFQVSEQQTKLFLERWQRIASYMKHQPGYRSTTLHCSREATPDKGKQWVNYARWDSETHFRKACSTPEFMRLVDNFPFPSKPQVYQVHFFHQREEHNP